jgi:hypothetical protein
MYEISDIKRGIRDPGLIRGEVRKYGLHFNKWWHENFYSNKGAEIFQGEWDNLIILDGCRYDIFKEINNLSGDLQYRISKGSTSWEFMEHNFLDGEFHDTVYISANPHIYRLNEDIFHAIVDLLDRWESSIQTVPPSEIVSVGSDIVEEYPNKRYIFHFMQPHYPFLGPTGSELNHRGHERDVDSPELDEPNIWEALQWNKESTITTALVWEAYEENVEIALSHTKDLLKILEGRSVITSDHGNLIGDRLHPLPVRGFGHPAGLRAPELIKVPWLSIEDGTRREIKKDPPKKVRLKNEEEVLDYLSALGYT